MTVWYKQGVMGCLQNPTRKGLGRVADLYESRGQDLFVTSLKEGNHSPGSLHYDGFAFDIRKHEDIPLSAIKEVLGPEWDVIEEPTHIHCEFDPKH